MEPSAIRDLLVEAFGRYNRTDVVRDGDDEDRFFDDVLRLLADERDRAIDVAGPYLEAESVRDRAAAAEIVGRVGEANAGPLKRRAYELLFDRLLRERNAGVLNALSAGVGLIWSSEDDDQTALALVEHDHRNVRYAVAEHLALITTNAPEDADRRGALERLRRDSDEDVRWWAEFGLDTLTH